MILSATASRIAAIAVLFGLLILPDVARATDLHVTIETSEPDVSVGGGVAYTIRAHNTSTAGGGPLDSPNTKLEVQFPDHVEIGNVDASFLVTCDVEAHSLTCSKSVLERGDVFSVVVWVYPNEKSPMTTVARVSGGLSDPVPDNNIIEHLFTVHGSMLEVTKLAPEWVLVDGSVNFVINVLNVGPDDAVNVRVQDVVSAVFVVVSYSTDRGTCSNTGQTVTCNLGLLPAGQQARISIFTIGLSPHPGRENTVVAAADNASAARHTISVAVLEPEEDTDGDGVSNGDEAFAGSNALEADYVDLLFEKTGPSQAYVGDKIEYLLTVTNVQDPDRPGLTAQNVEMSDLLPQNLEFVSATGDYDYNPTTRLIVWSVGSLAPGESKSESVRVRVNGPGNQEIINSGAALGAGVFEVDNLNNTSTATTFVLAASTDLSIAKSGPDTLSAGQTATYSFTVANAGPDDASEVRVTDVLPEGLSFESNGSDPACSSAGQTVTCDVGNLAAGQEKEILLVVSVADDVEHLKQVVNAAGVSGADDETDPSSVNDEDSFNSTFHNPAPPCKAYVLLGDFNGTPGSGVTGRFADLAASEAVEDYQEAGYVVVRIDSARSYHLTAAVNDPETKAIWFLGHGAYQKDLRIALLNKWFGTPDPGLGFHDRYAEPRLLRGAPFPNIQQVTIHACSQDLPEWRALFPTAVAIDEFDAWDSPTRGLDIYLWQKGASYPKCPNDDGSSNKTLFGSSLEVGPTTLHPRLWPEDALHDRDSLFVLNLAPVTNSTGSFVLDDEPADALEGASFNLYTYADSIPMTFVFSAIIEDGRISLKNQFEEEIQSPDFNVEIRLSALDSLRIDPDLWASISTSGSISLENEIGTSLSDENLLDALGTLLYGYPPIEVDLALDAAATLPTGAGGSIEYAFGVTNEGDQPVRDAQVVFEMPENVSMSGGSMDCAPHAELQAYVCHTGPIPAGGSVGGAIDVTIDGAPGEEHETLVVAIASGYEESDLDDNDVTIVAMTGTAREIEEEQVPDDRFALYEPFPNPFSSETTIRFQVPQSSHVMVRIHDILGREVARLADGAFSAGSHDVRMHAHELPSGLYIVVLEADGQREARTMTLVR